MRFVTAFMYELWSAGSVVSDSRLMNASLTRITQSFWLKAVFIANQKVFFSFAFSTKNFIIY